MSCWSVKDDANTPEHIIMHMSCTSRDPWAALDVAVALWYTHLGQSCRQRLDLQCPSQNLVAKLRHNWLLTRLVNTPSFNNTPLHVLSCMKMLSKNKVPASTGKLMLPTWNCIPTYRSLWWEVCRRWSSKKPRPPHTYHLLFHDSPQTTPMNSKQLHAGSQKNVKY